MSHNANGEIMKADKAATKIQANFRGYRVRKLIKDSKPSRRDRPERRNQEAIEAMAAAASRTATVTGAESDESTLKGTTKKENAREALEEKSATKIQAGIRGFLVRKRHQTAQAAATRIQAGFRGFRTRKLLKQNGQ